MSSPNTVLVPVDLADGAERVAHYAATLAARSGDRLVLFAVLDPAARGPSTPSTEPDGGRVPPALSGDEPTAALAALSALAEALRPSGVEVETCVVAHRSSAEAILAAVEERRPAAVVMGTNARAAPGRFVLGSVAEAVVRRSSAPVFTVRVEDGPPPAAPRRVLVGVDLSPLAAPLVRAVAAWAGAGTDEVVLCYAVESGQPRGAYGLGLGAIRRATFPRTVDGARRELDALAARWWHGAPVQTVATHGPAGRVILAEAERVHADLVVVATHGWRGLDLVLVLGSVAGRVLRQAACPVLTFTRASLRPHGAM